MKPKAASDSIASRLSLAGADVQAIATRVVGMPEGIAFVKRQLENPRPATRRKAERFLKRWAAPK
jgi:hypothetical protein